MKYKFCILSYLTSIMHDWCRITSDFTTDLLQSFFENYRERAIFHCLHVELIGLKLLQGIRCLGRGGGGKGGKGAAYQRHQAVVPAPARVDHAKSGQWSVTAEVRSRRRRLTRVLSHTKCWANAGLLLGQRRRRWPSNKPALVQRLVFARVQPWIPGSRGWGEGDRLYTFEISRQHQPAVLDIFLF